jgi:O-succinylbenzoate synthase
VDVNALLMGEMADLRRAFDHLEPFQFPHAAVKLKVARGGPIEEEITLVKTLLRALRPDQRLRLDANGGWTYVQALAFWQAVADDRVEYVEEPTSVPSDFERLWRATGLRYALDESLRRPVVLSDFPHSAALVIKPTMLGGPDQLRAFTSSTIPCVFSAAFESGIGIVNIARLANQLGTTHPVGLDTYRWLADDVLSPRLSLDRGQLDLSPTWSVDYTRLDPL